MFAAVPHGFMSWLKS